MLPKANFMKSYCQEEFNEKFKIGEKTFCYQRSIKQVENVNDCMWMLQGQ